jgi:hypothetical protein
MQLNMIILHLTYVYQNLIIQSNGLSMELKLKITTELSLNSLMNSDLV